MVRARPPTGAKLVGGTDYLYLTSKAVILKWRGGGVGCVHLPFDPLLFVCTSSAEESWLALQQSLSKLLRKS